MIGFRVCNLLIPEDPTTCNIKTALGVWSLQSLISPVEARTQMKEGKVVETHILSHPVSLSNGAAVAETVFDEITPLLLGATFFTGLAITIMRSTPDSEVMIIQPTNQWPRNRAVGNPWYAVSNANDFVQSLELFMKAWPQFKNTEKLLLLVHYWLDGLACWSLEDQYLSTTTLLQIIADTEKSILISSGLNPNNKNDKEKFTFFNLLKSAARRKSLRAPSRDWVDMRNALIHEGSLLGGSYSGMSRMDCTRTAEDVLCWIDEYIKETLGITTMNCSRFAANSLITLNSYSIS